MILIEKIYRYSWSYDAHYRFFCVHNSCHQLMGYDGVENRGLYLNCVWDCSVDYDTSRPYGFSISSDSTPLLDDCSPWYQFTFHDDYEKAWQENCRILNTGRPVIIALDRYYLPYAADFSRRHGAHAALLFGYAENTKKAFIVDWYFKDCVVEPVLFFETSRGCYWGVRHRCNFCAYDGYRKHFSPMHPSVMIAYLNTMFARYSDRCKYFIAVDSCLAPRYLDTVFPYVTIPSHVSILYDVRVTLTRDQLRRLASYRIHLLLAGIESFSSDALALLNKGTTAFDNIAFMKNCRRYGLEISWNILVNIPGETIDMLKQTWRTMQALTHLYPPKGVWLVSFQGNCRYADNPSQFQIQLSPLTESLSYVYPFLEKALQALTYFKTRIDEKDSLHNRQHLVMINRMIASAEIWKSAWRVDKKNLPNLYRDEDTIYDNRTSIQSYTLMEKQIDILDYLEQPHSLEEISKYMGISVETALGQIKYLCDKQLLFEENNCYISLVL